MPINYNRLKGGKEITVAVQEPATFTMLEPNFTFDRARTFTIFPSVLTLDTLESQEYTLEVKVDVVEGQTFTLLEPNFTFDRARTFTIFPSALTLDTTESQEYSVSIQVVEQSTFTLLEPNFTFERTRSFNIFPSALLLDTTETQDNFTEHFYDVTEASGFTLLEPNFTFDRVRDFTINPSSLLLDTTESEAHSVQTGDPTADLVVDSTDDNTGQVCFDASGSSDPQDATADLDYRYDFTDDGTWDTSFSQGNTLQCNTYSVPSSGTCRVEVRDTDGNTDQATTSYAVGLT